MIDTIEPQKTVCCQVK